MLAQAVNNSPHRDQPASLEQVALHRGLDLSPGKSGMDRGLKFMKSGLVPCPLPKRTLTRCLRDAEAVLPSVPITFSRDLV